MEYSVLALIVAIVLLALQWLWKVGHKNYDVFEKNGIPYLKPTIFIGNAWPYLAEKVTLKDFVIDICNRFPAAKIVGLFERQQPIYVIKDPELIKQLGVKDFEYFIGKLRTQSRKN